MNTRFSRRRRSGVTLLECVLAVTLLGLASATVTGAISFCLKMQARNDVQLSAAELANRIIIQYLDDDREVNRIKGQPLDYGVRRYGWEILTDRVKMQIQQAENPSPTTRQNQRYDDRYRLISVSVWELPTPGVDMVTDGEKLVTLVRLIDPFAPRNPVAMKKIMAQEWFQEFLQRGLQGGDMGAIPNAPGRPAGGAPGRPRPPSTTPSPSGGRP